jgi:hypothetical protein
LALTLDQARKLAAKRLLEVKNDRDRPATQPDRVPRG